MGDSPDMFGNGEPLGEAETTSLGLDLPSAPASPPPSPGQPYRVLARKYRPQTFAELIGQEPMVRTLANAIRRDRLAHAFLMTGVRGVGKTSTARLIAKALNCTGPDGTGGPTIDPCGTCEPCLAIAEGRHIDVIEMDAASHTGIDDIREIIEAVRYAAVSARYKIYIVDEVHMLSKQAFNGLLKTLEEPPPHVKFVFATTEVDKLPVTVLSRCQRFDLRRIAASELTAHFAKVCRAEGVLAEDEALAMIAAAAEGSVRDGLSILDQAIAHADLDTGEAGGAAVTAAKVREMLGLADKTAQRRLLSAVLAGDGRALLDLVEGQYALGVEPVELLRGQLELVHRITVAQLGPDRSRAASEDERAAIDGWSAQLGAGQLHRLWQLLLKGHEEVRLAPDPLSAAQMALLRVLHAADLPDPGTLARTIEQLAANGAAVAVATAAPAPEPVAALDWGELVERVKRGHPRVGGIMEDWVRVVELAPDTLRFQLAPGLAEDPAADIRDALQRTTGGRWQVERAVGEAQPALREVREAEACASRAALLADPMVKAAFAAFPDAELIDEPAPMKPDETDNLFNSRSRRA